MSSSYKEQSNLYKQNKKGLVDGYEDAPHKKKRAPHKTKRSKHKHDYVPAIFESSYCPFTGKKRIVLNVGWYCKECGRVKEFDYLWGDTEKQVEIFKKENPQYSYKKLPDNWNPFKDKNVPISRGMA